MAAINVPRASQVAGRAFAPMLSIRQKPVRRNTDIEPNQYRAVPDMAAYAAQSGRSSMIGAIPFRSGICLPRCGECIPT